MKNILVSITAFLLAAALLAGFTACGKETMEAAGETTIAAATEFTAEEPTTAGPAADIPTEVPDETATASSSAENQTTQPADTVPESLPNPVDMAKAALIEWYNDRIRGVREQRPGMTRVSTLNILAIETTLLGGMIDGIVNAAIRRFMPGEPVTETIEKGKNNRDFFLGSMAVPVLRPVDVSSITAKREGGNYVIAILLRSETNPKNDGVSTYARIGNPATGQDILDKVGEMGITGDEEKVTLFYRDGKLAVTVNPAGEIIGWSGEFFCDAQAKEVRAALLRTDLTARQHAQHVFSDFIY